MRRILGTKGEKLAWETLKKIGYKIVAKNYTCVLGEIDLIAWDNKTLVFIEVRSRKEIKYGMPAETVNHNKQRKIRKVAEYFLVVNRLADVYCRFDVVGIVWGEKGKKPQIEIFKDAF